VENVKKVFAELSAEYDQIALTLLDFDPRLTRKADAIRALPIRHAEMISAHLACIHVPTSLNSTYCAMHRKRDFLTNAELAMDGANMELGLLEND
jgi:hypothetical protein